MARRRPRPRLSPTARPRLGHAQSRRDGSHGVGRAEDHGAGRLQLHRRSRVARHHRGRAAGAVRHCGQHPGQGHACDQRSRHGQQGPDPARLDRPLVRPSSDVAKDWLAEDPEVVIGPPHVLTDGAYVWPADLPHYVRNYHVRLPNHFVIHMRRNDFQVPADVDVASWKLE